MCYYKQNVWRSKLNSNIESRVWSRPGSGAESRLKMPQISSVHLVALLTRGRGAWDRRHLPFPAQPSVRVSPGGRAGRAFRMLVLWLPLPWDGDATLIPAHVVIGGPKANVAKADRLLAILAVVALNAREGLYVGVRPRSPIQV